MLKRLHSNRGLTLVELMIAALIMAFSGFVLYFMFNQGYILMVEQEHKQLVFELAKKRLAIYKHASDAGIIEFGEISGEEELPIPANLNDDEDDDEYEIIAHYTVTVRRQGLNDYFDVEVAYTWEEQSGREYEIKLKDAYPLD